MTILEQMKKLEKKHPNNMEFGRVVRDLINTIDEEVKQFSEEIIDTAPKSNGYIYESPDGGKTVFRRPMNDYNPKNKVEVIDGKPTGNKARVRAVWY